MRHRQLVAITIFAALCSFSLFAQPSLSNLLPRDARSMGMGGSSLVFAEGYGALWGNPAGLANKKSLTLVDSSTWMYIKPTPLNIKNMLAVLNREKTHDEVASILDELIAENGFGGGECLGFGWTGDGMGLGLTSITDAVISGSGLSNSALAIQSQVNAVFGMAWPIRFGPFELDVGASVRGYYRMETLSGGWAFSPLAEAVMTGSDIYSRISKNKVMGGFGLSIDAGATLSIGPLGLGCMVRDIADRVAMKASTIQEIADSYMVPSGGSDYYSVSPVYTAGLSLSLDKDSPLSASFFVEANDPVSLFADLKAAPSKLHIGTEITLIRFLAMRMGYNQGYVSLGAGLKLWFLDVNAAMFTEPVGVGDQTVGRTGIVVQAAIRF
jgi:hypothetical protein